MDENDDPIINYAILGFIFFVVGWLLYKHTGTESGQIEAVYWAGVVTPLLAQIARKVFNLKKSNGKKQRL